MSNTAEKLTQLNGVDVQALADTIGVIKADPDIADFQFRARNQWIDGGHNRSNIRDFFGAGEEQTTRKASFVFDCDEPEVLLGRDRGANPVEYLLHALAGCMTTSLVYHAAARGIKIDSIESEFEGDLDLHGFLGLKDDVAPGYQSIRARFRVKADATEEELMGLFKFSPVCDTVCRPVQVEKTIELVSE